jgi:Rod binding domain-containing protein
MDISAVDTTLASMPGGVLGQHVRSTNSPETQRKAAASQFEAILLRQFLNDSVGSMMGGEKSAQGSVYGYLLTDVLSQKLAQGGGLGLAKTIEQQLTPAGTPVSAATLSGATSAAALSLQPLNGGSRNPAAVLAPLNSLAPLNPVSAGKDN